MRSLPGRGNSKLNLTFKPKNVEFSPHVKTRTLLAGARLLAVDSLRLFQRQVERAPTFQPPHTGC